MRNIFRLLIIALFSLLVINTVFGVLKAYAEAPTAKWDKGSHWSVDVNLNYYNCMLHMDFERNSMISVSEEHSGNVLVVLQNQKLGTLTRYNRETHVTLDLDGRSYSTFMSVHSYSAIFGYVPADFIRTFAQARSMTVYINDVGLARYNLQGSYTAVSSLNECTSTLREHISRSRYSKPDERPS